MSPTRRNALAIAFAGLLAAPSGVFASPVESQGVDVPALIASAAERYGLPAYRMECIAWRESTYRPWVTSPGGHRGLFQFADRTWAWASEAAGVGGMSPYDPWAATEAAAWLMSQPGGFGHWSTARWCR